MKALTSSEVLGLAATALGVLLLTIIIPAGIDLGEVEPNTGLLVRPDFWPMMVAGLLTVTGLGYFAASRISGKSGNAQSEPRMPRISLTGAAAIVVVVCLMLLASNDVGLLIPAILMFAITAFSYGSEQRWLKVALAIAIPCILVLFFDLVANVDVPVGNVIGKVVGR